MLVRLNRLMLFALCLAPLTGHARPVEIQVRLDDAFLQQILEEQIYTEVEHTARAWDDGKDCNRFTFSAPEVDTETGQLRTRSVAQARIGTAIGETCLSLINWSGFIEIFQEPLLSAAPGVVEFRVVDSKIYAADGESRGVMGTLWDWLKRYAHPRFNRLRIDLYPLLTDLRDLLGLVFPGSGPEILRTLDSVALGSVEVGDGRIELGVRFDVPERAISAVPVGPEPELTPEELARWEESWHNWDAFLTMVIKHAGADTELQNLRLALLAVLLDARQDILEALVPPGPDATDPVPELFVKTWERLSPELRQVSGQLPSGSVLRYLSFIAAADALAAIESLGEPTGFALTADALRRMARMIAPATAIDPLHYDTAVDPELRQLFGFGPPLPLPDAMPEVGSSTGTRVYGGPYATMLGIFLPALIVREQGYIALVERLSGWVPTISVLDEYLPLVRQLLDHIAHKTQEENKLEAAFRDIYQPLVLATAWQESCWRQYVKVRGEIRPIRSHAGAVGIMQVNQHVWRGFYDVDALHHNVGYNAEAGSEILHHYLVDYAIAKGEHNHDGGIDNLARATYAMYNGGPKHMTRYRKERVSRSLRAIDQAFWDKYQAVRSGNALAVAECYTGR